MDKIWYISLRSLAVVVGMKKRMTTQNRQKSNAKLKKKGLYILLILCNQRNIERYVQSMSARLYIRVNNVFFPNYSRHTP